MKTVILAGGQGTRIRDVPEDIPKALLSIGNKPIIWHIMKYYSQYHFNDFILCLGYKSYDIKNFFLNLNASTSDLEIDLGTNKTTLINNNVFEKWKIILAETGVLSQTGCRINKIKKYIHHDKYFFLTYGDGLCDVNIGDLLKFHKKHGKHVTVTGVKPPGRFGALRVNKNTVTEFTEKPKFDGDYVSGGFFVCSREIFNYLTDNEGLVFEKEPLINIARDNHLMVYKHHGFWQPMDTSVEYQLLNDIWKEGNAPWKLW